MKILQFLEEDNGNLSATRLLFLAWGFTVLITWAYLSVLKGTIQPVDTSIVGVLGSLGLTKLVQKFGEKPTPPGG